MYMRRLRTLAKYYGQNKLRQVSLLELTTNTQAAIWAASNKQPYLCSLMLVTMCQ
jgi:hypothetical protein